MTTNDIAQIAELRQTGLTVCTGPTTGLNITCSLKLAEYLGREKALGNVLYLNTVQPDQFLYANIRKDVNKDFSIATNDGRVTYETSIEGIITADKTNLGTLIASKEIKYVILNSWEFASKDYRRKEELIFMLLSWMQKFKVTVVIFAEQVKQEAICEKIQRGIGIGKLAAITKDFKILTEAPPVYEDIGDLLSGYLQPEARSYSWAPRNDWERDRIVHLYMAVHPGWNDSLPDPSWPKRCALTIAEINKELESKQMGIKQWIEREQKVKARLVEEESAREAKEWEEENQLDGDEFEDSPNPDIHIHYGPDKLPVRIDDKKRARELFS